MKIPYTQQFSPNVTPLGRLRAILRQHDGVPKKLVRAIASAFFKATKDPEGMASNTLIALKYHGILDNDSRLTVDVGRAVVNAGTESEALAIVAKNMLVHLDGINVVETLRDMKKGGQEFNLGSVKDELRIRGFEVSDNSSDLSGVLNWLREAGVLVDYDVIEGRYSDLVGTSPQVIDALKGLEETQVAFLRAMVALSVRDWTEHNLVVRHAESLFSGQVSFNWKDLDKRILTPLRKAGFIEVRKAAKSKEGSRGGKPAQVKPTEKFDKDVSAPILEPLYRAAGYRDISRIRSIPLSELVANIKQRGDENLRGQSLEWLAIRFCQLLALDFMGWRETDEEIVGGGEVDGFMHTARLIYSRWQIQCKASDKISYETLAKEVGVVEVTLANVILIVGTGSITDGAKSFRQRVVAKSSLNIILIDGEKLDRIVKEPSTIGAILEAQARDAMQIKPAPTSLMSKRTGGDDPDGGGSANNSAQATSETSEAETGGGQLPLFKLAYDTPLGCMYQGDAYDVMQFLIAKGLRVKLLFTSPPFALIRKKEYGNEDQERYVTWFMRFAPLFRQILEPDGSFVMDIGGSWLPGLPARSIYQYKLLLKLCESGFYLAQEFFHYNPAKLPTPAEWVTVRRLRVKDAMNNVWWFVKDPFVDSDNRRVLREYSRSMKQLLKNGYVAKKRPSGHDISTKFGADHGGSIPPNLLEFANTDSNGHYLKECKRHGIKPHPARFPTALPDFFIRFLTRPGQLVFDPFAGSNVTGEAAEALGRRWIASEISEEYVTGSRYRFNRQFTAAQ